MGTPGMFVLIVDDDPMMRALLAYILDSAGFKVVEASDGLEALAVCTKTTVLNWRWWIGTCLT